MSNKVYMTSEEKESKHPKINEDHIRDWRYYSYCHGKDSGGNWTSIICLPAAHDMITFAGHMLRAQF